MTSENRKGSGTTAGVALSEEELTTMRECYQPGRSRHYAVECLLATVAARDAEIEKLRASQSSWAGIVISAETERDRYREALVRISDDDEVDLRDIARAALGDS